MATDSPNKIDLFNFMVIRPPNSVDPQVLQQKYIHDRGPLWLKDQAQWRDVDFQSANSPSAVGHAVYEAVFCISPNESPSKAYSKLLPVLLGLLTPYYAPCENSQPPKVFGNKTPLPLQLSDLERHAYMVFGDLYYLLPDQLDAVEGLSHPELLIDMRWRLNSAATDTALNLGALHKDIAAILRTPTIKEWVFHAGIYAGAYADARRKLFDALYLLYVLRRQTSLSFEGIISGLQTLHILEALAIDEFIGGLTRGGPISNADNALLSVLALAFPTLKKWDRTALPDGFPLIDSAADVSAYLTADVVVSPLFAKLFYYVHPFNDLKPLGVGDLKVVKQWLIGYVAGEISDIHNIMKGESKSRIHRRLEKTDQTFSFTSDQEQESTKDTQSTDRFEVKREAENIVKTDLNVNANTNVQYKNAMVIANVDAGFSYANASTNDTKNAQNYSREVVSKAVSRVQSRTTQTRTVTQIFETRELNRHTFDNTAGTGHVSGIYRWLDKQYRAQLYNYGKRMMFEFVLPEPAAFYVESRLRAFEASLDCPQPPTLPKLGTLTLPFQPANIDEAKFDSLRLQYDLAEFTYPIAQKNIMFMDAENNQALFEEDNLSQSHQMMYTNTFQCSVNAKGYQITKLRMDGSIYFEGAQNPATVAWKDRHFFSISVDGTYIVRDDFSDKDYKAMYTPNDDVDLSANPAVMNNDSVSVVIGVQNAKKYTLILSAQIELTSDSMLDWQTQVYNKVKGIEQKAVDDSNAELTLAYNTAMTTYENRLQNLQSTVINDLLQGRSEDFNADVIRTELKRQCLSMLTKEFDANPADDVLTDLETMGSRNVAFEFRQLTIHEKPDKSPPTSATMDTLTHKAKYPLPKLSEAQRKGRYIQFLEQAFEWLDLSYIFYPYFWSTTPKWVDLMNRSDTTDPALTAFLQAGSARILIAVTPAYDSAVLHYLATREPWDGGPAPVIGDPLYLPLYQELKNQQDDLANAVPEGDSWDFRLPTSLVYLEGSSTPLPTYPTDAPTS